MLNSYQQAFLVFFCVEISVLLFGQLLFDAVCLLVVSVLESAFSACWNMVQWSTFDFRPGAMRLLERLKASVLLENSHSICQCSRVPRRSTNHHMISYVLAGLSMTFFFFLCCFLVVCVSKSKIPSWRSVWRQIQIFGTTSKPTPPHYNRGVFEDFACI